MSAFILLGQNFIDKPIMIKNSPSLSLDMGTSENIIVSMINEWLIDNGYTVSTDSAIQQTVDVEVYNMNPITSDLELHEIGNMTNFGYVLDVDVTTFDNTIYRVRLNITDVASGTLIAVSNNEYEYYSNHITNLHRDVLRQVQEMFGIASHREVNHIDRITSIGFGGYSVRGDFEGYGISLSFKKSRDYNRIKPYFAMSLVGSFNVPTTHHSDLDRYFIEDSITWVDTSRMDLRDEYNVDHIFNTNFLIGGGVQQFILEGGVSIDIAKTNIESVNYDREATDVFTSIGFIVKATTMIQTKKDNSINVFAAYSRVNNNAFILGLELDLKIN